jgi:hypothetical protein
MSLLDAILHLSSEMVEPVIGGSHQFEFILHIALVVFFNKALHESALLTIFLLGSIQIGDVFLKGLFNLVFASSRSYHQRRVDLKRLWLFLGFFYLDLLLIFAFPPSSALLKMCLLPLLSPIRLGFLRDVLWLRIFFGLGRFFVEK